MSFDTGVTATLADILELRAEEALAEREVWSLLGEAVQTLQDLLLSSKVNPSETTPPLVSPRRLGITSRGKVLLKTKGPFDAADAVYLAPECPRNFSRGNVGGASHLEKMWIYSLGKVLVSSWKRSEGEGSRLIVIFEVMVDDDPSRRCSLKALLDVVFERWQIDLPLKPWSHSLMDMYREVFGPPVSFQCLPSEVINSAGEKKSFLEREMDKENCWEKRSCESLGNGVRRTDSRMYRGVLGGTKGPHEKGCGPEFVVRGTEPAMVLRLAEPKKVPGTSLWVILLTGEKVEVVCDPETVTCGQVLRLLVDVLRLRDDFMFGVARLVGGDFIFVPHETKMHKVAPPGWKNGRTAPESPFLLHMRVKFFFPDLRGIKSSDTKHLIYLQLRRSLLERQIKSKAEEAIVLAGLALQAEFGDFDDVDHGIRSYFLPEHYLPEDLLDQVPDVEGRLRLAHRSRGGLPRIQAEEAFVRRVQALPGYGRHHCSALWLQQSSRTPVRLAVGPQGVSFSPEATTFPEAEPKPFPWRDIHRLSCDRNHLRIHLRPGPDGKPSRYRFLVPDNKGFFLFRLASAQHRFFLELRTTCTSLASLACQFGVGTVPGLDRKVQVGNGASRKREMAPEPRPLANRIHPRRHLPVESPHPNLLNSPRNELPASGNDSDESSSEKLKVAYVVDSTDHSTPDYFNQDLNESVSPQLAKNLAKGCLPGARLLKKVCLVRDAGGSYGLQVVEGRNGGIYVANVLREDGQIKRGDELVVVDGTCLLNRSYRESLALLRMAGDSMQVLVSRNCDPSESNHCEGRMESPSSAETILSYKSSRCVK